MKPFMLRLVFFKNMSRLILPFLFYFYAMTHVLNTSTSPFGPPCIFPCHVYVWIPAHHLLIVHHVSSFHLRSNSPLPSPQKKFSSSFLFLSLLVLHSFGRSHVIWHVVVSNKFPSFLFLPRRSLPLAYCFPSQLLDTLKLKKVYQLEGLSVSKQGEAI